MSTSIVIEDGRVTQTISDNILWNGQFSAAWANGSIVRYVQSILPMNTLCVIPRCDGNINRPCDSRYIGVDWDTQIQPYLDYATRQGKRFIIGTLAQETEESDPNLSYLYLPLDDLFFDRGVMFEMESIPWTEKSSQLCWRGGCSGFGGNQSLRVRFVDYLYHQDANTDVRLSNWWALGKDIPEVLFRYRIPYTKFFRHKIIFIVDGNVIASNQMYAFASGSVPFVITQAKCWFSPYIQPFVHYIPISPDFSDLMENIRFVQENEDKAQVIAKNAVQLTRTLFSPEGQRRNLDNQIRDIMSSDRS